MIAKAKANSLSWTDFPFPDHSLERKMSQLARFSFAFLSTYYPMLEDIAARGGSYRAPWFIKFFAYKSVDLRSELDSRLKFIKEYCENYLLWLAKTEFSVEGKQTPQSNLINFSSFSWIEEASKNSGTIKLRSTFDLDGFDGIKVPGARGGTLASLWSSMNGADSKGNSTNGTWYFINELYRQCGK
jgi:hypothetical protein